MIASTCSPILVFLGLLVQITNASAPMEPEYRIKEEIPIGSQVGNLVDDVLVRLVEFGLLKLPNTATPKPDQWTSLFTFKVLNYAEPGVNCFEIKSDGRLVTTRRIDREQLCDIRKLKPPGAAYGMMERASDSMMLQSSGRSGKSRDSDNQFCLITIHCAVYPVLKGLNTKSQSSPSTPSLLAHLNDQIQPEQTFIQIRILIEDINDNAPFWPGHLQRFQVQFRDGDPIGEKRTLPPALDMDVGNNARIQYELVSASSSNDLQLPFSLIEHPIDGLYLYTTKQIDREEQANYQLYLKAVDSVTALDQMTDSVTDTPQQHTTSLLIDVHVEDINDNAPLFTQPIFTPAHPIPETTPVGKTILVLNATDADSELNGAFHFGFSREHGWLPAERFAREYFEVRPNGHVVVRRPLNVDQLDRRSSRSGAGGRVELDDSLSTSSTGAMGNTMQFRFRVLVEDEAVRPYTRSSEATVVIVVRDENDEAPIIHVKPQLPSSVTQSIPMGLRLESARFGYLVVEENQPSGTKVATVQVYDPDFEGTDPVECRLRTANFTLSRARDAIEGSGSNFVSGMVEYHLITAIELDREATVNQKIPILCSDMAGHYTEQNVTVHITDVNDNRPQFVQAEFAFQVEENAPAGTPLRRVVPPQSSATDAAASAQTEIEQVTRRTDPTGLYPWNLLATDLDIGLNAGIHYHVLENGRNSTMFTVDPISGAMKTATVFDREQMDHYMLQAFAIDKGDPPLTGSVAVKVTILDVNDNPPQFTQSEYSFHIAENQPRSTKIGQISATDLDSELHGPLAYFLSTDRDALAFRLDRETGVLRSRQPLDREEQGRYVFRVLARDGSRSLATHGLHGAERSNPVGTVQLTGTATVTVIVDDVNDNWPVFISPNATANTLAIAVDETLGHKLAYIQAEDADQDENGLISYHIRSGNAQNLFGLDSATGLLYLAGNLGKSVAGDQQEHSTETNESTVSTSWPSLLYKPSFHMLTLEACDHGRSPKPHCTLFSNLKIIIKNPKDEEFDVYAKRNQLGSVLDPSGSNDGASGTAVTGQDRRGNRPEALLYGEQNNLASAHTLNQIKHNPSEIVIICLSIVFTVVLMATLLLICLLRKRSVHYFSQKKILTESQHEQRDRDWEKACSSTQLAVETKPGLESEQDAVDSSTNTQLSESKLHEQELPTYPRTLDSLRNNNSFVPVGLSKEQYLLLTRTVDTRRRNLPRDLQSPEPPNDLGPSLVTNENQFPTSSGLCRVQPRLQTNKPSRSNDYQTLDYLGLVSTAIPQRYPHLYATQRRLTYSPLGPTPMRMYPGSSFIGIRPTKTDSILLTHMNHLAATEARSPQPEYKGSDSNYMINHCHSRSQPQPMDRRSVLYPLISSSTLSTPPQANLAPLFTRPLRPGIRGFQQPAIYQPIASSAAKMKSSAGPTALYGTRIPGYPMQSNTYYDIRQPDQQEHPQALPKSKSQQISRHNSKPSPLTADLTDEEISVGQRPNSTEDSVGMPNVNSGSGKGEIDEPSWRQSNVEQAASEWVHIPNQNGVSVGHNVSHFMSSPVEPPKYVAAAYKEASFV